MLKASESPKETGGEGSRSSPLIELTLRLLPGRGAHFPSEIYLSQYCATLNL